MGKNPRIMLLPLPLPLLFAFVLAFVFAVILSAAKDPDRYHSTYTAQTFPPQKPDATTPQVNSNPTMQTVPLADTNRQTTRLGFGCGSIMGATNRRDSLKLLETAYDAGIRHFDVAPMYGYGEAETCLGEFLEHHRGQITVTTKYGIAPPKKSAIIKLGRSIAGPILKQLPSLKPRLAKAANAATRNPERPSFTAAQSKASLDRSLTALRTDHIDLWLLHEATARDLQDDTLLSLLEAEVKKGTIGAFGIGSSADKIPAILNTGAAYCRTLQYEWSILDPHIKDSHIKPSAPFRIHHRALTDNFRGLHAALIKNQPLCQRWCASTNTDLNNAEALAHLMLKASLVMNPSSIILFSSKNPAHIHANVHSADDTSLELPARQLYNLVQTERDQLLRSI
jgi:D-threo-aldose 1-dehydrogenase